MAYNRAQLRAKIYAFLGDNPVLDKLGAAIGDTTGLTFTGTTYAKYADQMKVEIESEAGVVNGDPSSTTITLFDRGADGTTAATHANGSIVRINPGWFNWQANSAISDCLQNRVLKVAESVAAISIVSAQYIYNLPAAIKADRILNLWYYDSDNTYRGSEIRKWDRLYGTGTAGVDQIEFHQGLSAGREVGITYLAPYTNLTDDTTTCDLPDNETAQLIPVYWACHQLLSQKETPRLKRDKGSFKKSSPPLGAREKVASDWLNDFVSACISAGLTPNIPGGGYVGEVTQRVGR